jgi:hypothetical protein
VCPLKRAGTKIGGDSEEEHTVRWKYKNKTKENNRKEGRRRKRDHEIFKYIPVGQGRNQPGGKSKCHFGGPNTKK